MRRLWIQAANEAEYEEIEEWILYKLGPLGMLGDELPTVIQTADRLHVKELSPAYGVIGEALPLMIEHFGAENLMVKEFPIEPPQEVNRDPLERIAAALERIADDLEAVTVSGLHSQALVVAGTIDASR